MAKDLSISSLSVGLLLLILPTLALSAVSPEPASPFTTDTPLRIASVTKALTALLVLQQVEAATLSLDVPVKRHLADFDGPGTVRAAAEPESPAPRRMEGP